MPEQRELAGLIGCLEQRNIKAKCFSEAICECEITCSVVIEHADSLCALTGFDNQQFRTGVKPGLALLDPLGEALGGQWPLVFLTDFKLDRQAACMCHLHDRFWFGSHGSKAFSALNARNTEICAQIKICWQLSLRHCDLKRPSARDDRYAISVRGGDFLLRGLFVRDQPAGHRNF